jgi:CheY-like chemotaxis protein
VYTAANGGREAIQSAADFNPDMIVLDVGMPEMSGYEAARRIRALHLLRQPMIITATGRCGASDKMACEEAGFDVYMIKPLELEALGRPLRLTALLVGVTAPPTRACRTRVGKSACHDNHTLRYHDAAR